MNVYEKALKFHEKNKGKVAIKNKVKINNLQDLALAYTPGVAEPCRVISQNPQEVYKYTFKSNTLAVISNGTAVLGLGDIGAKASIPVMEGKVILFKKFADIDAFPICIDSKNPEEIINISQKISPVFGAINLEDIKSPECFEIEEKLKQTLDIPVLHDDQHGTAIVVSAGVLNALKVVKKKIEEIEILIIGAGAAGIAITRMLLLLNVKNIVVFDKNGPLHLDQTWKMNSEQQKIAAMTNKNNEKGKLEEVIKNKDIVIGVSTGNVLNSQLISTMNKDAIVFALANPVPEILPEEAKKGGARIIATGRSDFPNQINNILAFPGIFRGSLDAHATTINLEMKKAAIIALASIIPDNQLNENNILPIVFEKKIVPEIAKAVAQAARKTGVIRK
ncbi:NAD(P)-dependent malic enzyme [Candidatus Phytoplasma phoenicium]|uniref:Malate dehydrogenase n=1 Tax=Candidatus Phytoplasma phoenicium TaxID=198422 RepID=A0A0L0MK50_9MOLU|nr:malic enzyme-like NAD(P)-binding protein [Candidatus Phytoplasma phoenicium]KND62626.1 malate dehydrogenase [Candidatus Phytoplasma phoenicium]